MIVPKLSESADFIHTFVKMRSIYKGFASVDALRIAVLGVPI